MSNKTALLQWQFASLISRFIAVAAGIVQGIFVVRLLSAGDYGLVGIVGSVAGVIGVYQHLGLASGSTREISATKTKEEAFKVFVSSLLVRLSISFPLAFGLWILAPHIANNIYSQPAIILPLRIQAVVLLLQGVQDILGASLSGSQKFKPVLIYQSAIALVSLGLYILLISQSGFLGYYWALLAVSAVGVFGLGVPVFVHFVDHFTMPRWREIKHIVKAVLSIGIAIYAVKIIYTFWQRLGPLFLGTRLSAEDVGIFNFALFYGTKLLTVSEAFSTINLPVMTKKFVANVDQFKQEFMINFYKIYSFILLAGVSAIYWAPEILHLVVGSKYNASIPLIAPLVFAFWCYGYVNLLGASVIVPAKLLKEMIGYYAVLFLGTVGLFFGIRQVASANLTMALASAGGAALSLITLLIVARQKLSFSIFDSRILEISFVLLPLLPVYFLFDSLLIKIPFYIASFLVYLYLLREKGIFDIIGVLQTVVLKIKNE